MALRYGESLDCISGALAVHVVLKKRKKKSKVNCMNELRYIAEALDGYSVEGLGFAIRRAHKEEGSWCLLIEAYDKHEDEASAELDSYEIVAEIIHRLDRRVKGGCRYALTYLRTLMMDKQWSIELKQVKKSEDKAEDEESAGSEEQE